MADTTQQKSGKLRNLNEVRRFPRTPIGCILFLRQAGSRQPPTITVTRSLGLDGCMFPCERSLGIGTLLSLSIVLGRCQAKTTARVVHEYATDRGIHEVEVEFVCTESNDRAALQSKLVWSAYLEAPSGA